MDFERGIVAVYEIDFCAVCLAVVVDDKIPTKIYPHGTNVIMIDHIMARDIARGFTKVVMLDGTVLPMFALTTVKGTRVCARHTKDDPWE